MRTILALMLLCSIANATPDGGFPVGNINLATEAGAKDFPVRRGVVQVGSPVFLRINEDDTIVLKGKTMGAAIRQIIEIMIAYAEERERIWHKLADDEHALNKKCRCK